MQKRAGMGAWKHAYLRGLFLTKMTAHGSRQVSSFPEIACVDGKDGDINDEGAR